MDPQVSVRRLRGLSIVAEDDAYYLACLLLKLHLADEERTGCRGRHTVHGLAGAFAFISGVPASNVERALEDHGLDPAATIEPEDAAR